MVISLVIEIVYIVGTRNWMSVAGYIVRISIVCVCVTDRRSMVYIILVVNSRCFGHHEVSIFVLILSVTKKRGSRFSKI